MLFESSPSDSMGSWVAVLTMRAYGVAFLNREEEHRPHLEPWSVWRIRASTGGNNHGVTGGEHFIWGDVCFSSQSSANTPKFSIPIGRWPSDPWLLS